MFEGNDEVNEATFPELEDLFAGDLGGLDFEEFDDLFKFDTEGCLDAAWQLPSPGEALSGNLDVQPSAFSIGSSVVSSEHSKKKERKKGSSSAGSSSRSQQIRVSKNASSGKTNEGGGNASTDSRDGDGGETGSVFLPASDFVFQTSSGFQTLDSLNQRDDSAKNSVETSLATITTGVPVVNRLGGLGGGHFPLGGNQVPSSFVGQRPFPFAAPNPTLNPPENIPGASLEAMAAEGGNDDSGEGKDVNADGLASYKRRKDDVDWTTIEDPVERKKQKRLAKNRHTAAVSRERRKKHMRTLEEKVQKLEMDNASMKYWLDMCQHENQSLRMQLASLQATGGNTSGDQVKTVATVTAEVTGLSDNKVDNRENAHEPAVLDGSTLLAIMQLVRLPVGSLQTLAGVVFLFIVTLVSTVACEGKQIRSSGKTSDDDDDFCREKLEDILSNLMRKLRKWALGSNLWDFMDVSRHWRWM